MIHYTKKVRFEGFEPTAELKTLTKSFIWKLEEQSPGDSSQKATFIKTKTGFTGDIKISSKAGTFSAQAESEDLNVVLTLLFAKICEDLSIWKKNRIIAG